MGTRRYQRQQVDRRPQVQVLPPRKTSAPVEDTGVAETMYCRCTEAYVWAQFPSFDSLSRAWIPSFASVVAQTDRAPVSFCRCNLVVKCLIACQITRVRFSPPALRDIRTQEGKGYHLRNGSRDGKPGCTGSNPVDVSISGVATCVRVK